MQPSALGFTGMRANPPEYPRQRQSFHDELDSLLVLALANELDISLDINSRRAGDDAGCSVHFLNGKGDGYRLGKGSVCGISRGNSFIPFARPYDGADDRAFATARTDPFFDVAGITTNLHLIVTDEARYFIYLAIGKQFDIWILSHRYHLRGSNTGGTVEGGEGLIKLEHMATDGGLSLYQIGLMARFSNIKGCLHAGDTTTHHEDVRMDIHPA